jgi:quercetin dioxygenase-like cupin family protein
MFYRRANEGYISALEGIFQKTLVYGDKTLLTEFKLEKGSMLPRHNHPHEQTGYLVSGKIRLSIGDEEFDAMPGDCWSIPENVEHGALILADSVAVEVFSPIRTDYLPSHDK